MIGSAVFPILILTGLTCLNVALAQFDGAASASSRTSESGSDEFQHGTPFAGFNLISPLESTRTFLVDNRGKVVNHWRCGGRPALSAYLLEDGHLLRACKSKSPVNRFETGGVGGRVEKLDWDGNLIWEFEYATDKAIQHHDIEPLPNGNVLLIAWEHFSPEQAIKAGRDPQLVSDDGVWVDQIVEVQPRGKSDGEIVWIWRLWDHLIQDVDPSKQNYGDVAKHPEKLDFNFTTRRGARATLPDWTHFNSIDYRADLDQILVSCHGTSEIFIIDHSTTIAQAAGETGGRSNSGGDLLYRWGNRAAFRLGSPEERQLFSQHDARWIESGCPGSGNILVFNNGLGRPDGRFSSIEEIQPPLDSDSDCRYRLNVDGVHGPEFAKWSYTAREPADFFSPHISGSQRLPNGNTLVCCGAEGWFFEVSADGRIVWEMVYRRHSASDSLRNMHFVLGTEETADETIARAPTLQSHVPTQTPRVTDTDISDRKTRPDVFRITRYPKDYFSFDSEL